MAFAIPVQRSTNWANKPTGSWSLCWFQINPSGSGDKRLWIYESHIPFRPELLFRPYFHYCLSSVQNYEDRFHIHVFIHSSNIWLSYIHSREQLVSKFFLLQSKWISNFVIVDCNRRWHCLCSMFTPLKVRSQRGEKYTGSLTLWFPEVINM